MTNQELKLVAERKQQLQMLDKYSKLEQLAHQHGLNIYAGEQLAVFKNIAKLEPDLFEAAMNALWARLRRHIES